MPYIITSDDPQDIIALFVRPKYDSHMQAWREHNYKQQIRARAAATTAWMEHALDDLRAARQRPIRRMGD